MVSSTSLPSFHTPCASDIITKKKFKTSQHTINPAWKKPNYSFRCKATSFSSSSSSVTDFDLYDLLGIDSSSDQLKVKTAYRALQKRCHPDIAGPPGHDMAIILNEAYAILSNPNTRSVYDKELAKTSELRGYTGKPLYSTWCGSENEERAVFVDEVACIGCLKCALFANKTFAIESKYGRARVVAQWADSEPKIQEAIDTCPVDCISVVERSDLAALEFLMSKQPRGNVRIGVGNTVGARVTNIFNQVKTFQKRYEQEANKRNSAQNNSMESTDPQKEAINSAVQAIRAISNWLYWHSPTSHSQQTGLELVLLQVPRSESSSSSSATDPSIDKLREAAAARKNATSNKNKNKTAKNSTNYITDDEYWVPSIHLLPASPPSDSLNSRGDRITTSSSHTDMGDNIMNDSIKRKNFRERSQFEWGIPVVTAIIASIVVQSHEAETAATRGLEEHVGGPSALGIVNSSWLHALLAGVTWYFVGLAVVRVIQVIRNRGRVNNRTDNI